MKIEMVIFDMAGTTINEDNIVYKTLQKAINNFGVEVDLHGVLAIGAGQEKLNAIKDIVKVYGSDTDIAKSEDIFKSFISMLDTAYHAYPITAMPNAASVLMELRKKNILVVLNTGYDKKTAQFILEKINWNQYEHFDLLVTASDVKNSRPAPDMIEYAMNKFSLMDTKNIIKVGDSKIDIEEGKNANCLYSIGITTGAQNLEQLKEANPDYIIHNLSELIGILNLN